MTFSTEADAKAFGADIDKYGWTAAKLLQSTGVKPLADDDVSQLGLLRARIAGSAKSDWNRIEHRAVLRDDLAVAVELRTFEDEALVGIPDIDPMRTVARVFWHGSLVDEVGLIFSNGSYQPSPWAWGSGYVVSVWEHAAARFMDRLFGYGYFDQEFEKSGVKVRKRLPRHR